MYDFEYCCCKEGEQYKGCTVVKIDEIGVAEPCGLEPRWECATGGWATKEGIDPVGWIKVCEGEHERLQILDSGESKEGDLANPCHFDGDDSSEGQSQESEPQVEIAYNCEYRIKSTLKCIDFLWEEIDSLVVPRIYVEVQHGGRGAVEGS